MKNEKLKEILKKEKKVSAPTPKLNAAQKEEFQMICNYLKEREIDRNFSMHRHAFLLYFRTIILELPAESVKRIFSAIPKTLKLRIDNLLEQFMLASRELSPNDILKVLVVATTIGIDRKGKLLITAVDKKRNQNSFELLYLRCFMRLKLNEQPDSIRFALINDFLRTIKVLGRLKEHSSSRFFKTNSDPKVINQIGSALGITFKDNKSYEFITSEDKNNFPQWKQKMFAHYFTYTEQGGDLKIVLSEWKSFVGDTEKEVKNSAVKVVL